jgi:putative ABC transport system ATP-binding protein
MENTMEQQNGGLLKHEGVKKVFLTDEVETHAPADIHLEIREGEYVSIAGPSGCGKTTLLSILGLLDTPTGGNYSLAGTPDTTDTGDERCTGSNGNCRHPN